MKTFLRDDVSADIFSNAMLSSPAYQARPAHYILNQTP